MPLPSPNPATKRPSTRSLRISLAPNHHLLRLLIESHFLTGLNRRNVHAKCDGVTVTSFDAGIRCLPRANTFHPVAHVCRGLRIALRVSVCRNRLNFIDEGKVR